MALARDIQKFEYIPLGPFGAKNFATTISPWIVTLDALEPFKCATSAGIQDPQPHEYLQDPDYSSYDISLEVPVSLFIFHFFFFFNHFICFCLHHLHCNLQFFIFF